MPFLRKIDSNGNFLIFRGLTVVAAIADDRPNNLWESIYNSLQASSYISQYYALLPYSSYHMTTYDLFTEDLYYPKWFEFIKDHKTFFQSLHAELNQQIFQPLISIEHILISGVLQLIVSIPESQISLIHKLAQEFKLGEGVPHPLHITLAYGIKDIEDCSILQAIRNELEGIISPYKNKSILLSPPKLCYFNNMTQFIPWDGEANPFIQSMPFPFFNTPKEQEKTKKTKNCSCSIL